jgi:hypothetical protein
LDPKKVLFAFCEESDEELGDCDCRRRKLFFVIKGIQTMFLAFDSF